MTFVGPITNHCFLGWHASACLVSIWHFASQRLLFHRLLEGFPWACRVYAARAGMVAFDCRMTGKMRGWSQHTLLKGHVSRRCVYVFDLEYRRCVSRKRLSTANYRDPPGYIKACSHLPRHCHLHLRPHAHASISSLKSQLLLPRQDHFHFPRLILSFTFRVSTLQPPFPSHPPR